MIIGAMHRSAAENETKKKKKKKNDPSSWHFFPIIQWGREDRLEFSDFQEITNARYCYWWLSVWESTEPMLKMLITVPELPPEKTTHLMG